jgi:ParB family transcriptional regulator, chromosome partitioning protein
MGREVIQYLSPDKFTFRPQLRKTFSERELLGLARSLQEIGFQQPVRGFWDSGELVSVIGERRIRAARLAGLREIPVIIEEKPLTEGEIGQRQFIENFQRSEVPPSEVARGLKRLIETTGWQMKEAAAKCGLSNSTATKLLAILDLPEEIQRRVDSGEIARSGAYELNRVTDPEKQAALAQQMAEGRLTRDALSGAVKSEANGNGEKPSSQLKRITAALGDGETVIVAGPALTLERVIAVCEELLAKARRARTRGVDLKAFARQVRNGAIAAS